MSASDENCRANHQELLRKIDELQTRNDELAAAARAKDEFIATLSHELRTPLSAVLLWAKLLQTTTDPAQLAEGLEVIETSALAQTRLIDDLLDAARLTTGKLRLDLAEADLLSTAEGALQTVRPAAQAKGIDLLSDLDPDAGSALVDSERICQVVWNLLANAIKFTPAGGQVRLSMKRHDAEVVIIVSDTGAGIEPQLLAHVFERFTQGTSPMSCKGLGLGLMISKQLVEMHGGTITAASAGPGKGSTFTVRLPLPRLGTSARPEPAGSTGALPDLRGRRVLIVEDETATRDVLAAVLQMAGAQVVAVDNGTQALAEYRRRRPDVILSDVGLPDSDGYLLLNQLHQQTPREPRPPAVALTAYAQDHDRRKALDAGYAGYLSKPVAPGQLILELGRVLKKS